MFLRSKDCFISNLNNACTHCSLWSSAHPSNILTKCGLCIRMRYMRLLCVKLDGDLNCQLRVISALLAYGYVRLSHKKLPYVKFSYFPIIMIIYQWKFLLSYIPIVFQALVSGHPVTHSSSFLSNWCYHYACILIADMLYLLPVWIYIILSL